MKIKLRSGFVSNSSSSSFIIGFKRKPRKYEDVLKELFAGNAKQEIQLGYRGPITIASEIAKCIYEDIRTERGARIKSFSEFQRECSAGYFEGQPAYDQQAMPNYQYKRNFNWEHGKDLYDCQNTHPEEFNKGLALEKADMAEWQLQREQALISFAAKEWEKFKDKKFIYVLGYADDDGSHISGYFECSNFWYDLPVTIISHH